MTEITPAKPTP